MGCSCGCGDWSTPLGRAPCAQLTRVAGALRPVDPPRTRQSHRPQVAQHPTRSPTPVATRRATTAGVSTVPPSPRELRRGTAFGLDFLGELLDLGRGHCQEGRRGRSSGWLGRRLCLRASSVPNGRNPGAVPAGETVSSRCHGADRRCQTGPNWMQPLRWCARRKAGVLAGAAPSACWTTARCNRRRFAVVGTGGVGPVPVLGKEKGSP